MLQIKKITGMKDETVRCPHVEDPLLVWAIETLVLFWTGTGRLIAPRVNRIMGAPS